MPTFKRSFAIKKGNASIFKSSQNIFSNQLIKKESHEMKFSYSFGYVGLYHIQCTLFFLFVCL